MLKHLLRQFPLHWQHRLYAYISTLGKVSIYLRQFVSHALKGMVCSWTTNNGRYLDC